MTKIKLSICSFLRLLKNSFALLIFSLFINGVALAQLDTDYKLDAGDKIKILVFEEPDMSFEVLIDNAGVISYPYLGEILIKGKSTSELEKELVQGLKGRVLIKPDIAVSVVEYRSFSIGGEVKNPGNYPFEPNLTLRKAINLAGGVTEWSNGKRFKIDREQQVNDDRLSLDSYVYPGDVVTILPRRF